MNFINLSARNQCGYPKISAFMPLPMLVWKTGAQWSPCHNALGDRHDIKDGNVPHPTRRGTYGETGHLNASCAVSAYPRHSPCQGVPSLRDGTIAFRF